MCFHSYIRKLLQPDMCHYISRTSVTLTCNTNLDMISRITIVKIQTNCNVYEFRYSTNRKFTLHMIIQLTLLAIYFHRLLLWHQSILAFTPSYREGAYEKKAYISSTSKLEDHITIPGDPNLVLIHKHNPIGLNRTNSFFVGLDWSEFFKKIL